MICLLKEPWPFWRPSIPAGKICPHSFYLPNINLEFRSLRYGDIVEEGYPLFNRKTKQY